MIKKVFSATLVLFFIVQLTLAQPDNLKVAWVDSVFNSLSPEEQIAQLLMVPVYSKGTQSQKEKILSLVDNYKIGGVIFMQGTIYDQAKLTNQLQSKAQTPLLVGTDAEWGLGMRLKDGITYPKQMALGAIKDDSLIYELAGEIARQLKLLGVHINFAPVIDVNSNSKNPVIGVRSFGESPEFVAKKAYWYMKGLQDNGIVACAKHFPGHGDTDKDSHLEMPVVSHNKERLEQVELKPFKALIDSGIQSIMSAHLLVSAYDKSMPVSLSSKALRILRKDLGFEGLIFSDALNMKAVTDNFSNVEVEAIGAGNDIILFPKNIPKTIKRIKKAYKKRKLNRKQLEESVKRVLKMKFEAGLHRYKPTNLDNITLQVNRPKAEILRKKLIEKSITIVNTTDSLIPIRSMGNKYFASLNIGEANILQRYLEKYAYFDHYNYGGIQSDKLAAYDYVVVGITQKPSQGQIQYLKSLDEKTNLILSYFGTPYDLKELDNLSNIICTYQNDSLYQVVAAETIFGAIGASGKLPVSISSNLKTGIGYQTTEIDRLGYSKAESVFMDSRTLDEIDIIAKEAINDRATPGCQVLVARNGKIVYEKSFGYYTYDSLKPVSNQSLYDIASITKVMASLPVFMFMEERGLVDLDKKLKVFLPELAGSNKENMIFRDVLTHQAGLWPYIPFWKQTIKDSLYRADFLYEELDQDYQIPVSSGLYGSSLLRDSVWQWVIDSKLREKKYKKPYNYKYSDMGYYFIQRLAENNLNQPMESFLQQNLYDPMGLATLSYLPLCKYPLDRIVPTEYDNYFRRTLVYGMVHDQGAALLGGVAGHAGLFSNANDLAKMMYMNLNLGFYGGQRYFQEKTVEKFASQQYETNRRALGWDKPYRGVWYGPTSEYTSEHAFGHTGFTGTAAWADPEFDLIYIFLSNRIHPDAENTKLIKNNIRTRIQDVIYESIWNHQPCVENIDQ